jgi:hypothetical protein
VGMPTMITVQGTFVKADGTPETGVLEFYSKVFVLESDGNTAVVPSVITAPLDYLGRVQIALPATDDPDWRPVNWNYTLVMKLSGAYTTFNVAIPYDTPSGILPASKLVPVVASSTPISSGPHTHAASDIVSGTIAMSRLPVGTAHTTVAFGDHTHDFTPAPHNHDDRYFTEAEVTTALNLRAPLNHSHAIADTTDLQAALDAKAAASHTHSIANVTGLQSALDGKAATAHSHVVADVTGLQDALNSKQAAGDYATTATVNALTKIIVLDADDPVPGGTPAGTVIVRTA